MRDLIASLVDRALGRTPVLERRPASVFEPVGDGVFTSRRTANDGLEEEESFSERNGSDRKQSGELGIAPAASPVSQAAVHTNEVSPRRQRSPEENSLPSAEIRAEVQTVSAIRQINQSLSAPLPETSRVSTEGPPVSSQPIETIVEKRVHEPKASQEIGIDETEVFNRSIENADESHGDAYIVLGERHEVVKTKPAVAVTEQIAKPAVRVMRSQQNRASALSSVIHRESQPIAESPAPTINVTIGRVEVRATSGPQRAQPSRSAGPKLSLDDYLRSRAKGN